MKDQPSISTHFRNSDFKHKMKRLKSRQNSCTKQFYVHEEKIKNFRNCRHKFIKSLLPEKRKETM